MEMFERSVTVLLMGALVSSATLFTLVERKPALALLPVPLTSDRLGSKPAVAQAPVSLPPASESVSQAVLNSFHQAWQQARQTSLQATGLLCIRGPFSAITPGLLEDGYTIWSDRPFFLWSGRAGRLVVQTEEGEEVWNYSLPADVQSLHYQGLPLQPGQVYEWGLTSAAAAPDDPPDQFYIFQIMTPEQRTEIAADLAQVSSQVPLPQDTAPSRRAVGSAPLPQPSLPERHQAAITENLAPQPTLPAIALPDLEPVNDPLFPHHALDQSGTVAIARIDSLNRSVPQQPFAVTQVEDVVTAVSIPQSDRSQPAPAAIATAASAPLPSSYPNTTAHLSDAPPSPVSSPSNTTTPLTEEIAIEQSLYFLGRNLWSDAIQQLYRVPDPSPAFLQVRQTITNDLACLSQ